VRCTRTIVAPKRAIVRDQDKTLPRAQFRKRIYAFGVVSASSVPKYGIDTLTQ
jgi:hypothetical protein